MRRQGSGLVIYISSGAGRVVLPGHGFHCASKFALEAFAEAYSYELASQCIDSAIVEPGAFATAIFEKGGGSRRHGTNVQLWSCKRNPATAFRAAHLFTGGPARGRRLRRQSN